MPLGIPVLPGCGIGSAPSSHGLVPLLPPGARRADASARDVSRGIAAAALAGNSYREREGAQRVPHRCAALLGSARTPQHPRAPRPRSTADRGTLPYPEAIPRPGILPDLSTPPDPGTIPDSLSWDLLGPRAISGPPRRWTSPDPGHPQYIPGRRRSRTHPPRDIAGPRNPSSPQRRGSHLPRDTLGSRDTPGSQRPATLPDPGTSPNPGTPRTSALHPRTPRPPTLGPCRSRGIPSPPSRDHPRCFALLALPPSLALPVSGTPRPLWPRTGLQLPAAPGPATTSRLLPPLPAAALPPWRRSSRRRCPSCSRSSTGGSSRTAPTAAGSATAAVSGRGNREREGRYRGGCGDTGRAAWLPGGGHRYRAGGTDTGRGAPIPDGGH